MRRHTINRNPGLIAALLCNAYCVCWAFLFAMVCRTGTGRTGGHASEDARRWAVQKPFERRFLAAFNDWAVS